MNHLHLPWAVTSIWLYKLRTLREGYHLSVRKRNWEIQRTNHKLVAHGFHLDSKYMFFWGGGGLTECFFKRELIAKMWKRSYFHDLQELKEYWVLVPTGYQVFAGAHFVWFPIIPASPLYLDFLFSFMLSGWLLWVYVVFFFLILFLIGG